MSYLRFTIDLAFEEPITPKLEKDLNRFKNIIKKLKKSASKIGEEYTTKAGYHRCLHDENKPCEPEIEI